MKFDAIRYSVDERVATITLNRPEKLNAISSGMPEEIAAATNLANEDDDVHVIIVTGDGRGFCAGFDLEEFAESERPFAGSQYSGQPENDTPWDPMADFYLMNHYTQQFMSLWRSYKPTIAKINGPAVGAGSDIALCCDILLMAEEATIGYPPSRVWGSPSTAMWSYRVGAQMAKRLLFTGDLIDGKEAARIGLCLEATPLPELDAAVASLAKRVAAVPKNQLMMQKMLINQSYDNMGLQNSQMIATLFDGIARHSPEGVWFKKLAEQEGFKHAVRERDSGAPIAEGISRPLAHRKSDS